MPALNYAEQYSSALANAYPYVLNFGALWNTENSSKYKVVDAKTIKIPSVTTQRYPRNSYRIGTCTTFDYL